MHRSWRGVGTTGSGVTLLPLHWNQAWPWALKVSGPQARVVSCRKPVRGLGLSLPLEPAELLNEAPMGTFQTSKVRGQYLPFKGEGKGQNQDWNSSLLIPKHRLLSFWNQLEIYFPLLFIMWAFTVTLAHTWLVNMWKTLMRIQHPRGSWQTQYKCCHPIVRTVKIATIFAEVALFHSLSLGCSMTALHTTKVKHEEALQLLFSF